MKKIIAIIVLVLGVTASLMYFSTSSDDEAYYRALSNYEHVDDIGDTHTAFTSIDNPIRGDCEDFAFSLKRQIGGDVWAVSRNGNVDHAVLIKNGVVYDSLLSRPSQLDDYHNRPIYIIRNYDQLINNG